MMMSWLLKHFSKNTKVPTTDFRCGYIAMRKMHLEGTLPKEISESKAVFIQKETSSSSLPKITNPLKMFLEPTITGG